jgi:dTDP-glucose pyrophosphorylase
MVSKPRISDIALPPTATIRAAAALLQSQQLKFVLVCDERRHLLGTVTDGDIRRSILDDIAPSEPVSRIMNRSPKVTRSHENRWEIRRRMQDAVIRHLPEVDAEGRVVNIFSLDSFEQAAPLPNAVVLMVGGRGERLRPLTDTVPKPLLDIGGKPLLERTIEMLIGQGFRRFYLSVNYLGERFSRHFGDGSHLGVEIRYLREETPLGTAGALASLEPQGHPFAVMNGDILTKADLRPMLDLCNEGADAVMGARDYIYQVPFGCLHLVDQRVASIQEKPTIHHFISAGLYAFSPRVLDHVPRNEYLDMPDLLQRLIEEKWAPHCHHVTEEWIDIGSKDDLEWARHLYPRDPDA